MAVLWLIVHSVMNTVAQSGNNTAYSAVLLTQQHTVAVIHLRVQEVMNTTEHNASNTSYSAQC